MIPCDQLMLLGKITKKRGFEGQVILQTEEAFSSVSSLPEPVFIDIQGERVPFFISSQKRQGGRIWIILFLDMNDMLLERILQSDVFVLTIPGEKTLQQQIPLHPLEGFEVIDSVQGLIGTVQEVLEREMQPLLVIISHGVEILIPFTEEIVRRSDKRNRRLYIESPEGLIDLYINP